MNRPTRTAIDWEDHFTREADAADPADIPALQERLQGLPVGADESDMSGNPADAHTPEWLASYLAKGKITPVHEYAARRARPARDPFQPPAERVRPHMNTTAPDRDALRAAAAAPTPAVEPPVADDGAAGDAVDVPSRHVVTQSTADGPTDTDTLEKAPEPAAPLPQPPNQAFAVPAENMLPGDTAPPSDMPEPTNDPIATPDTRPDPDVGPVASGDALPSHVGADATPATTLPANDLRSRVSEYASQRSQQASAAPPARRTLPTWITRIGERAEGDLLNRKPDYSISDALDKRVAADQQVVTDAAKRAEEMRRYAAERAGKDAGIAETGRHNRAVEDIARIPKPLPPVRPDYGKETLAERERHNRAMEAKQADPFGANTPSLMSPEGIKSAANILRASGMKQFPNIGQGGAKVKQAIWDAAVALNAAGEPIPEDAREALRVQASNVAANKALAGREGVQANIESQEGATRAHMQSLLESSKGASLSEFPAINFLKDKWSQYVQGDPGRINFNADLDAVTNEFAGVMSAGVAGGHGNTDAQKRKAEGMIQRGISQGNLASVLEELQGLMSAKQAENAKASATQRQNAGGSIGGAVPERRVKGGKTYERVNGGWKEVSGG